MFQLLTPFVLYWMFNVRTIFGLAQQIQSGIFETYGFNHTHTDCITRVTKNSKHGPKQDYQIWQSNSTESELKSITL